MSTIVIFKLVSGEEIIATVDGTSTTQNTVTVSKARAMAVVQTGPQTYGLQLIPFLKGAPDEEFELSVTAIMGRLDAPMDIERSYISQTSSIEIATSLSPLLG
jgi:hypothetical protein